MTSQTAFSQLQAFFPDFVFWIVDKKKKHTHIVLVDPKGQTGIVNPRTLEENEKVNSSGHRPRGHFPG